MGIMCSGCFLLYGYEITKIVEKLPMNQDTSQDAHSDHFSSDEKSAHGDDKSHDVEIRVMMVLIRVMMVMIRVTMAMMTMRF